ncbi:MAG: hypothetical protein JO368_09925, partial [Acidimicrobiales bacterium]|nr:hypothetical protein [Acidimicrobiales bacterium]
MPSAETGAGRGGAVRPDRPGGAFQQVGERVAFEGFLLSVVEGTFEAPDGSRFERDIVR